jgi:hypothetical protein
MSKECKGTIRLDVRDSKPGWTPCEQPKAAGGPNVPIVLLGPPDAPRTPPSASSRQWLRPASGRRRTVFPLRMDAFRTSAITFNFAISLRNGKPDHIPKEWLFGSSSPVVHSWLRHHSEHLTCVMLVLGSSGCARRWRFPHMLHL